MLLIFGLAFELPLVMVLLNLAGRPDPRAVRQVRRLIIFGVFAFAAIATPSPDPITMLLLAVPCVVLVELAEIFAWANDRRRARRPSPYAGLIAGRDVAARPGTRLPRRRRHRAGRGHARLAGYRRPSRR